MKHALLVFLGGGLGSALRYGFGKIFQTVPGAFPMSTFTVNILGCFLIGIFMGYGLKTETLSENQSILLITGFCGGFTTFSAFAAENQLFLKSGDYLQFGLYTGASILLGLLALMLGLFFAKQI